MKTNQVSRITSLILSREHKECEDLLDNLVPRDPL